MSLDERSARMVLSALPEMGPIRIRRAVDAFGGSALRVLNAAPQDLAEVLNARHADIIARWQTYFDLPRERHLLQRHCARYLAEDDADYPAALRRTADRPVGLYARGPVAAERPHVAIVGTRYPSAYGIKSARLFAGELARRGLVIVSGLALGIDTEAHTAALDVGGTTIAVVANGLDLMYPPQNTALARRIVDAGGAVLSEFYFGRPVDKRTFPQRNRIVSGMSLAVLVIESDAAGGSMITARFAGDQGRLVAAVPGRIDRRESRGCHALIRDGATLVTSPEELLAELDAAGEQMELPAFDAGAQCVQALDVPQLTPSEEAIFARIREADAVHPDELCEATGFAPAQLHACLMALELKRLLRKRADGRFESAV